MLKIFFSLVLTFLGSLWIDILFSRSRVILSFPDELEKRSRFRKIFLFVGFFFCTNLIYNRTSIEFLFLMTAIFFSLLITATDSEQYVIFDQMLLVFFATGLIWIFVLDLNFVERIISLAVGLITFLILAIVTRGGIGGGDIKLIGVLGIWLGFDLLNVVTYGLILGGFFATIFLILKIKTRTDFFAYGIYFSMTALYFLVS